jgi:hypothetical protein
MGQYWYPVNLDKKEFINPHRLGSGVKLWEQLANSPGTGAALLILCAAMPEARGGGDFDLDDNWHGPERTDSTNVGEMPEEYPPIAKRTIGRWAGDRIALVGDYAQDDDLPNSPVPASKIYDCCLDEHEDYYDDNPDGAMYMVGYGENWGKFCHSKVIKPSEFTDVTDDVCAVIEHELNGKFSGTGWRDFTRNA